MDEPPTGEITRLLRAWSGGDKDAGEELSRLAYRELRTMARGFFAGERKGHTLQPTALIHEAFLRLAGQRHTSWQDRHQFFALAARMMRRVLVDHARGHRYQKRGGGKPRVPLEEASGVAVPQRPGEVIAVAEALERLAAEDQLKGSIVELRYFAGFTVEETAEALGCAPATVYRHWDLAKLWLYKELRR